MSWRWLDACSKNKWRVGKPGILSTCTINVHICKMFLSTCLSACTYMQQCCGISRSPPPILQFRVPPNVPLLSLPSFHRHICFSREGFLSRQNVITQICTVITQICTVITQICTVITQTWTVTTQNCIGWD